MRPLVIGLLSAGLLAGCGSGDDGPASNASRFEGEARDVAQVVDQLVSASRGGDEAEICARLFVPALATRVGSGVGGCEREVGRRLVDEKAAYTVKEVRVKGRRAAALVTDRDGDQSLVVLTRAGNDWRIARIRVP
jgi:hypothetical protein